jgi:ABC-type uncharacterized transport system permease subunit
MFLFLIVDFALVSSILAEHGSWPVGLTFLAAVVAVAWLTTPTRWRWVGLGASVGFGLMTLLTGGVCTLFGGNSDLAGGGLWYLAICVVLLAVAAIVGLVRSLTKRKPKAGP